ncbi:MAG: winged helix-turn-helix transcriptional regulator [Candidatus Dormibacteria bacterium]
MTERSLSPPPAALAEALDVIGDRWSLLLVAALLGGPLRFTDLNRTVGGIASNVLTERLRRLEAAGLLVSRSYSERPPRVEYRLTARGLRLGDVIGELERWAGGAAESRLTVHLACGTEMETRWYCATCQEVVQHPEAGLADEDLVHV